MLTEHAARATAAAAEGAAAGAVMLVVPEAVTLLSGDPQWSMGRALVDATAVPEAFAVAVLLTAAALLSFLYDRAAAAGDEREWDLLFGAGSGVLVALAALSAALPGGVAAPIAAGWMLAQGSYGAALVLLRRRGMAAPSPSSRSDESAWTDDSGALLPSDSLLPHD